jgi:hypothetical protein
LPLQIEAREDCCPGDYRIVWALLIALQARLEGV